MRAWIQALLLLALPAMGGSEVRRLALVVGVNQGLAGEKPLRYAARDAEEMASLLRRSGTFRKSDVHLLKDAPLRNIRASLEAIAGQVKGYRKAGLQSLVLLYFSGHGSSDAFHVRGEKLSREGLWASISSLESDLKILILDACESGDFLRQKGGRYLEAPPIRLEDHLKTRGTILLSSSSAGELAQESEEYRGAVFTHHLLNGLKGLGDYNGDRTVSLMEAFDYARTSTRLERLTGREKSQNPSFDFDLVGESDPVLTRLNSGRSRLRLTGMPRGSLEIYDGYSGVLAYKARLTGKDSVEYQLPPGRWILSFPAKGEILTKPVDLTWEGEAWVDRKDMRKTPKSLLTEKGGRSLLWKPHAIHASLARSPTPLGPNMDLFQLEYHYLGMSLHQSLSAGYGAAEAKDAGLANIFRTFRFLYGIRKTLMRWRSGQLTLGAAVSWSRILQSVRDERFPDGAVQTETGIVPIRRDFQANLYRVSLPLGHDFHLPGSLRLSAEFSPGYSLYRDLAEGGWRGKGSVEPGMSLGYQF